MKPSVIINEQKRWIQAQIPALTSCPSLTGAWSLPWPRPYVVAKLPSPTAAGPYHLLLPFAASDPMISPTPVTPQGQPWGRSFR